MSWVALLQRVCNWVLASHLREYYTPSIKFDFYEKLCSKCSGLHPYVLHVKSFHLGISSLFRIATWTDAALSLRRSLNFSPFRILSVHFASISSFTPRRVSFIPGCHLLAPSHSQLKSHTSCELQNVTARAHLSQWKTWKMVLLILRNFSSKLHRLPMSTRSHNAASNIFSRAFL